MPSVSRRKQATAGSSAVLEPDEVHFPGALRLVDLDQSGAGSDGLERGRRRKPHHAKEADDLDQPGRKHKIAVDQVASGSQDAHHLGENSLPIGDVMGSHAGCDNIKLAVGKIQPGRIHHREVQIGARGARPGSLDLFRIDIDACDLEIIRASNFAGGGADAASHVQVSPPRLVVNPAEQLLRVRDDRACMTGAVYEEFLKCCHPHNLSL